MTSKFLTPHARVLLSVAGNCDVRMCDLANELGMTERSVYTLLCELIEDGYLTRERNGRRNCYRLHPQRAEGCKGERDQVIELAERLSAELVSPAAQAARV